MKKSKKADIGLEEFVKWGIIIVGALILITIFFGYMFPSVWKATNRLGITNVKLSPDKTVDEIKLSDEGKAAISSFDNFYSSFSSCRDLKTGTGCLCDLDAPIFKSDYVVALRPIPNAVGFMAYLYKGDKNLDQTTSWAFGDDKEKQQRYPVTLILKSYEFKGLNLCTAEDLLEKEENVRLGYLDEQRGNLFRDSNGDLSYYHLPATVGGTDTFYVLGTDKESKEDFKLYRYDDSHICLFISRQGNEYGFMDGYVFWNRNKLREAINNIVSC